MKQVAMVFFEKGTLLGLQKKKDEALICFQRVIDRYGSYNKADIVKQVVNALFLKGVASSDLGNYLDAYDQVIQRYGSLTLPDIVEVVEQAKQNNR